MRKKRAQVFGLLLKLRQFCDDPCIAVPGFASKDVQAKLEKDMMEALNRANLLDEAR